MRNYVNTFLLLSLPIILVGMTAAFIPSTSFANQQINGRLIDPVLKSKLPDYYPDRFLRMGIVTGADPENRIITISSTPLTHGINTKVHTLNSNFASIQNLTIDTPVGFNYFVGADNTLFLTEAWVLPEGSVLAE